MTRILKKFAIYTTTNAGDKSKQYYWVVESDEYETSLVIRKLILTKDSDIDHHKIVKRFKNYYLIEQVSSMKLGTLSLIIKELNDLFNK